VRIVDARSGHEVAIGETVRYPGEEWWTLLEVQPEGFLSARARILFVEPDGHTYTRWVPLTVRFLHPSFLFQKVAFVPT
jgi:hypothetical protein